jgi:MFS family permease
MKNNDLKLKIALLSVYLITASLNAITAGIPEMAKSFPQVPLHIIELIATIPSLFQMIGVLAGRSIASRIGYQRSAVLGLLLCAIGGSIPLFLPQFGLIFVTRCIFGLGCGIITAVMLTMIIALFTGDTRSRMIGLTGSIGGLGSALSSFLAGRLLVFGWQAGFAVYLTGFAVAVLVAAVVPDVKITPHHGTHHEEKQERKWLPLLFLTILSFLSTLFATFYVIKASTLITSLNLGTAADGSLAITLISIGSLIAGAMYGKIYAKLKRMSVVLFYLVSAAGLFLGGAFHSLIMIWAGAFLIGWGLMAFTPYFQERVSLDFPQSGETGTSMILVSQASGAFAAPYLGTFLNLFTTDLPFQFILTGIFFLILACIALLIALKHRQKK